MKLYLILLAVGLIFIISCASAEVKVPTYTIGTPSKEKPVIKVTEQKLANPCEGIVCGENKYCNEGVCKCSLGFRACNDQCVPSSQCCTSSDCGDKEVCKDNICEQVKYCDFGQKWNEKSKKCECDYGNYWCPSQQSCIPMDNCCATRECNAEGIINSLCLPSVPQIYVCIKTDKGSHCTNMPEGERSSFAIAGETGDVFVQKVSEGGVSNLKIKSGGIEYLLDNVRLKEKVIFAGGKFVLQVQEPRVKGGFCSS